jgi:hypothetical protein
MQRHRCTKCRNPIRAVAVPGTGGADGAWYHPDCWEDVRASEQRDYEEQVEAAGLSALIAPYLTRRSGPVAR